MSNAFQTNGTLLSPNDSGIAHTIRRLLCVHTFEDDGNWSAHKMADYQADPSVNTSYHIVIDKIGVSYRENDDEYIPSSAMPTGNRIAFHFCLSGRAEWTREQWLARPKQLHTLAAMLAAYSKENGIPLILRNTSEVRAGKWGVCGHNEISLAFRESDHTDPGKGFPYDYVLDLAIRMYKTNSQEGSPMTLLTGESAAALHDAKIAAQAAKDTAHDNQIQLRGPELRGWPQLGERTLVDGVAAIGTHLGLPGFYDPLKTIKPAEKP